MNGSCVFCDILQGSRPADFVYKDDRVAVFHDIHPAAPVHLLVVPLKHIPTLNDLKEADAQIIAHMMLTARDVARKMGIHKSGYRLAFNVERGGGQEIFHLHMHMMGGWR